MKRRIFCATATLLAGIGIAGHAMAQTKWISPPHTGLETFTPRTTNCL